MFAQKQLPFTAATTAVIDLRFGSPTGTEYAKIGHLTIRCIRTGGADATVAVRAIKVNDGDTAPSASDISASADAVFLRGTATTSEEIQIGSKFAPGMNNDVYQGNYFTHVLVTGVAAGTLVVVGQ